MPNGLYRGKPLLTAEQKREKRAAYHKQYRAKNREHLLEQHRKYNAEHREVLNVQSSQYYAENREQIRDTAKKYYSENSDEIKSKATQYAKSHPEVRRRANQSYCKNHPEAVRRRKARQRAVKRNATVGDASEIAAWESKWRSKKTVICHWCRKRTKTTDVHVDHVVPLSKGGAHSVENLCVACEKCNLSKHAKLPEVWNAGLSQPLLFV